MCEQREVNLFVTDNCVEQYQWQITSFPTCNDLYNLDLTSLKTRKICIIENGTWQDVWEIEDITGKKIALKTIRFRH